MRWKGPMILATALLLPLAACQSEGEEAGADEAQIDVETPDVTVEDQQPDVIVDEEKPEEGISADVSVDEEGNVSGGVKVEDH